jgi:3-dehydroquinate dehydratase-2
MNIYIVNGPNLNLLGKREPEIYGYQSFEQYLVHVKQKYPELDINYFQSNHEGELIDHIHEIGFADTGIIFNPGGLTHTSVALADAVLAVSAPVIEVHISNIYAREPKRQHSMISAHAIGTISGLGLSGYDLALHYFSHLAQ